MKKTCSECGQEKDLQDFRRDKSRADGRAYVCRSCHKDQYLPSAAERQRVYFLKTLGTTEKQWNRVLNQYNCRCAICDVPEVDLDYRLCVDHDHKTGKVRGPLCRNCNSAIGMLQEDPKLFKRAVQYLEYYAPQNQGDTMGS